MFTAFNERNDFSYAFEKIRNAISTPGENNLYAATELGLGILLRKYEQFRQELNTYRRCDLPTDHRYRKKYEKEKSVRTRVTGKRQRLAQ